MDIVISAVAHRTGSTLVQRIFNARRETLIWGEHGGIVTEFVRIAGLAGHFSTHGRAEKEAYFENGENPNTWIANMSPDMAHIQEGVEQAVKACFRAMYAEYREHHDRIGFKEVRYGTGEIELLKRCYPDALILLLVRHPVDIWNSETSYWSGDAETFAGAWNERALEYAQIVHAHKGIHLLRYEDLTGRDDDALRLLGELAGISRSEIEKVMDVKLNSTRTERPDGETGRIRELCRDGMAAFRYAE